MKDDNKIRDELKPLLVFTTSGGIAKLHKELMEPSSDLYPVHNQVHHGLHFLIGTGLQIIIFLWLLKIVIITFVMLLSLFSARAHSNFSSPPLLSKGFCPIFSQIQSITIKTVRNPKLFKLKYVVLLNFCNKPRKRV